MLTETKETLEELRNRLIAESRREPMEARPGYINGVLDFYNAVKKQQKDEESAPV